MTLGNTIRKTVQKYSSGTVAEGFFELDLWASSGNLAMNRLMSGSYHHAFPFAKTVVIAGESGSGKSLVAATAAGNAQRAVGALVVWVDPEHASREEWLTALGVDTSEQNFVYINASTIPDVKKIVSDIVKEMKKMKPEERQPVYMAVDSYNMLLTEKEMEEATKGELVGDQGQHAKQIKNLIKSTTALIGRLPICVVGMAHSMKSNDKYNPDDIITGGQGIIYAASLALLFNKLKLKSDQVEDDAFVDEEDNKKVVGMRCKANVYKSRFSKPNESIMVQVPYPHGIDRYSGLFDLMLSLGEIYVPLKEGEDGKVKPMVGWYAYSPLNGEEVRFRRRELREHADRIIEHVDGGTLRIGSPPPAQPQPDPARETELAAV